MWVEEEEEGTSGLRGVMKWESGVLLSLSLSLNRTDKIIPCVVGVVGLGGPVNEARRRKSLSEK